MSTRAITSLTVSTRHDRNKYYPTTFPMLLAYQEFREVRFALISSTTRTCFRFRWLAFLRETFLLHRLRVVVTTVGRFVARLGHLFRGPLAILFQRHFAGMGVRGHCEITSILGDIYDVNDSTFNFKLADQVPRDIFGSSSFSTLSLPSPFFFIKCQFVLSTVCAHDELCRKRYRSDSCALSSRDRVYWLYRQYIARPLASSCFPCI